MKAITLHQPWATLILDGRKFLETRSWAPPQSLLQRRLAIHAGKTIDRHAAVRFGYDPDELPTGVVVATALLNGVWKVVESITLEGKHDTAVPYAYCDPAYESDSASVDWKIDDYGDFSVGRYLWHLSHVAGVSPPAPAVGRQGLWEWRP